MNRHETDVVSLVCGAVFLAIAGIWLLFETVHTSLPSFGWLATSGLVLIGLTGIIYTLHPGTGRSPAQRPSD